METSKLNQHYNTFVLMTIEVSVTVPVASYHNTRTYAEPKNLGKKKCLSSFSHQTLIC